MCQSTACDCHDGETQSHPVIGGHVGGLAEHQHREDQEHGWQQCCKPTKSTLEDATDTVGHRTAQTPPFEGCNEDGQQEEQQPRAIAAFFGCHMTLVGAHASDRATYQVTESLPEGHCHAHRPHQMRLWHGSGRFVAGHRHLRGLGAARGGRALLTGGLTGGGRTSRHGSNGTCQSPQSREFDP